MNGLLCLVQFTPLRPLTSTPICLNCAHIRRNEHTSVCTLNGRFDPVTGVITNTACSVARNNETMCGPNGRFFLHYLKASDNNDDSD